MAWLRLADDARRDSAVAVSVIVSWNVRDAGMNGAPRPSSQRFPLW
jgi:hypothetical protein